MPYQNLELYIRKGSWNRIFVRAASWRWSYCWNSLLPWYEAMQQTYNIWMSLYKRSKNKVATPQLKKKMFQRQTLGKNRRNITFGPWAHTFWRFILCSRRRKNTPGAIEGFPPILVFNDQKIYAVQPFAIFPFSRNVTIGGNLMTWFWHQNGWCSRMFTSQII